MTAITRSLCRALVALACWAGAHAQLAHPDYQQLTAAFKYDRNAPLDVRQATASQQGGATVYDLTYASTKGVRAPAYLVVPAGKGPFAAVLWGHWMMEGSPLRNRKEFLDEAIALAPAGVVSLMIDTPMVRPGYVEKDLKTDPLGWAIQMSEDGRQMVIDRRRGLDLLLRRSDVDPKRVAYVGHSFDAHVGAILAGVEKRITNFVLMANTYSDEDFVRHSKAPEMVVWREQLGDVRMNQYFHDYAWDDPVYFVSHTEKNAIFLQFATGDHTTLEETRDELARFSATDKQAKLYEAAHALDAAARLDRDRWLQQHLKLGNINEKALNGLPQLQ